MKQRTNRSLALHVSLVTIVLNFLLSAGKLFAGLAAHSSAMISDAVHSASDVFSTVIVIIGVVMAGKLPDREHPYGHERLECVCAILLSAVLLSTGAGIGITGIQKVFQSRTAPLAVPGFLALAAALLSVAVKEGMYWYTRAAARKTDSGALMADAWHHRSDALSSVGSFCGILGARLGLPVLDPVAGAVISVFIIKAAASIFMDAMNKMVDKACDETTVRALAETAARQRGVRGVGEVGTRLFGNRIYVDVEILADGKTSLDEAYHTALRVHDAVEGAFPKVKHCTVCLHPCGPPDAARQAAKDAD